MLLPVTRQNDTRLTASLLGAVAALCKDSGAPLEPGERPGYDALVAEIKESLGGEDFAAQARKSLQLNGPPVPPCHLKIFSRRL